MKRDPPVSVVLPTYNRAPYLTNAIRSVLCQSMADFELIIVDDGSTDHTEEIVRDIEDPRIHFEKQQHLGASSARNSGIRMARGRYVAFQDSSDQWALEKLELQVARLDQSPRHVVAVYSTYLGFRLGHAVLHPGPRIAEKEGSVLNQLLKGNFIGTPTLLVRKSVLVSVGGFDVSLPRFQDWDLAIRLATCGEFAFIDTPLLLAREAPGSITSNKQAGIIARQIIYDKYKGLYAKHPKVLSSHLYRLALGYLEQGDLPKARGVLRDSWRLNRLNRRPLFALMFGTGWLRFTSERLV